MERDRTKGQLPSLQGSTWHSRISLYLDTQDWQPAITMLKGMHASCTQHQSIQLKKIGEANLVSMKNMPK